LYPLDGKAACLVSFPGPSIPAHSASQLKLISNFILLKKVKEQVRSPLLVEEGLLDSSLFVISILGSKMKKISIKSASQLQNRHEPL
jgi:hypothetical protein